MWAYKLQNVAIDSSFESFYWDVAAFQTVFIDVWSRNIALSVEIPQGMLLFILISRDARMNGGHLLLSAIIKEKQPRHQCVLSITKRISVSCLCDPHVPSTSHF